jgi:hypothetical protein
MNEDRRERADAVRNRRAILAATEELLATHRPQDISMEQVAAAAGVAKGTVFHRFGSRMGLMTALMVERAQALEEAVTDGPPPLGPGAPDRERLRAFLSAIAGVISANKSLLAELAYSAATEPHVTETDVTETDVSKTDVSKTDVSKTDVSKTDVSKTDVSKTDVSKTDVSKTDAGKTDVSKSAARDRDDHPVYRFWHGHISRLIAAQRPDVDAEMIAHVLLGALHSEPILAQLTTAGPERLTAALQALASAVLDRALSLTWPREQGELGELGEQGRN